MCRPKSEGGQRCAAHARPAYLAAEPGTSEWVRAAEQYASTSEGAAALERECADAVTRGNTTHAAALQDALHAGERLREANQAVARAARAARSWEPGDVHPTGGYTMSAEDDHGVISYSRAGTLHRLDGPAVEHPDGSAEYWREGEPYCRLECLKPDTAPAGCSRS